MKTTDNEKYDYYFALGYETKEQIDLLLKNVIKETTNAMSLASHTDSAYSRRTLPEGTTSTDSGYSPLMTISIPTRPRDTTLLNKFQVDFDVDDLPVGLDYYNPEKIDISVKFELIGSGRIVQYVNAYYGATYTRNLCATDDPTIDVGLTGVTGMPPCGTNTYYWRNIQMYTPSGDPEYLKFPVFGWHARFSPPATGLWRYSFLISINGGPKIEHWGPFSNFMVTDSANRGYIAAKNRNFYFTLKKDIFMPLGALGMSPDLFTTFNRGMYWMCTRSIDELALNKGNLLRVWCTYDAFGIEKYESGRWGAGNYDYGQDRAFDLDSVIEYAEQKGVYVQLNFDERLFFIPFINDDPRQPNEDWNVNPYKPFIEAAYTRVFPGLRLDTLHYQQYAPGLFFTDPECKRYYKRKLRYIMARWGYSTNVFAYEFFNEVTMSFFVGLFAPRDRPFNDKLTWGGTTYPEVPGAPIQPWQEPGYIQVSKWVNEMIDFCKNQCYQYDNHMFTISAPAHESNLPNNYEHSPSPNSADFVNLMNIDFYIWHFYVTSRYTDYKINWLATRAKWLYPTKPFMIGEYGMSSKYNDHVDFVPSGMYVFTKNYTGRFIFNSADLHSALFASILSGCGCAIQPFELANDAEWDQYATYYKPLAFFLKDEDLNWDHCIPIRNHSYAPDEVLDDTVMQLDSGHVLPSSIFNYDISAFGWYDTTHTRLTKSIEVFAQQYFMGINRGKIIGWVKNSNNWWLNLPHEGDRAIGYPSYNPDAHNPALFKTIYDVEITIENACNGAYKIEIYSVYPGWPLKSREPAVNGGVITTFQVTVECNRLTFKLPQNLPLDAIKSGQGPKAPDYGFKAIPIYTTLTWGYGYLGKRPDSGGEYGRPTGLQPFSLGEKGKLFAYASHATYSSVPVNCKLRVYFRKNTDEYIWEVTNLADINGDFQTSPDAVVALGGNDNQIFYKGIDGLLHCAYPVDTGTLREWQHVNFGLPVGGDIGCGTNGGRVFFRGSGVEGDLHFLLWKNIGGVWDWRHYNYTASIRAGFNQKPHPNTNFSINGDGSLCAYRTNIGRLALIYEVSPGSYAYDWTTIKCSGMVRVNNAGDVIFYTDIGQYLCAYYWNGSRWVSTRINTVTGPINITGPFDIVANSGLDNQVYFQGSDGYVHVAYKVGSQWVEGHILCEPEPTSRKCIDENAFIRFCNDAVFYQGTITNGESWYYNNFRAYYYGKGDVFTKVI